MTARADWQRAGRTGRRDRMAVNLTYARPLNHNSARNGARIDEMFGSASDHHRASP